MSPPVPDSWTPRTDAGARKLIEHLHEIADRLDGRIKATDEDLLDLRKSVNRRMKTKVGYAALLTILTTIGGAIIAFSVNAANTTRKEMSEARQDLAAEVRQVRATQDGIYGYLIQGKPKAAVIQEVKATLETIPPEKPKEK